MSLWEQQGPSYEQQMQQQAMQQHAMQQAAMQQQAMQQQAVQQQAMQQHIMQQQMQQAAMQQAALQQQAAMLQAKQTEILQAQQQVQADAPPPELNDEMVAAFMNQLGIEQHEDEDFGWIAELGLQSPLPPGWSTCTDDSTGYTYFVNEDSNSSKWESPLVPALQRIVYIGRLYLDQPSQDFFEEQKELLWSEHKKELEDWHGPFKDFSGRDYFVNHASSAASSHDPRVEVQYIYELQENFLRDLENIMVSPAEEAPNFGESAGGFHTTANGAEVMNFENENPQNRPQTGATTPRGACITPRTVQKMADIKTQANVIDTKTALFMLSREANYLVEMRDEDTEAQELKMKQRKEKQKQRRNRAQPKKAPSRRRSLTLVPLGNGIVNDAPADEPPLEISPMAQRRGISSPVALQLDDDDDQPCATENNDKVSALPEFVQQAGAPAGAPSAANFAKPPPSPAHFTPNNPPPPDQGPGPPSIWQALSRSDAPTLSDDVPAAPPPIIPQSPAFHKRQPGMESAAEKFLAGRLAEFITEDPEPA